MFNPRNNYNYGNSYNNPYQRNAGFGSRYQYQTLATGFEGTGTQASSLIGKVMGLLSFSFIFAALGGFVGTIMVGRGLLGNGSYLLIVIAGFITLFALQFLIQRQGINLFLLYLFTFLEGLGLGPLIYLYSAYNLTPLLAEAFLMTSVVSLSLGIYAWTTKRDFTRIGDYLFFGVILLIVVGLLNIFFHSTMIAFLMSIAGIGIFSAYVLFYVQRARYMADTLPNAIGLTVSLFLTMMNLFIYILQLLTILQGGDRRR